MDPTQIQNMMMLQQLTQGTGQPTGGLTTPMGGQQASLGLQQPNMYGPLSSPPPMTAPPAPIY